MRLVDRTARRTSVRVRRSAPLTAGLIAVLAASSALVGCLDRNTVSDDPTVKTNFETTVKQTAVDQVDILFMIDNSTSMGDKQKLLSQAVPLLVNRLVQPNCVDGQGNALTDADGGVATVDPTSLTCATGTPEFPAVHDMHIGIVSSSLGDFGVSTGGDNDPANWACAGHDYTVTVAGTDAGVFHTGNDSQNDHAQLLNRTQGFPAAGGGPDPEATPAADPSNYLSWFPMVTANDGKAPPITTPILNATDLSNDFESLVTGVQQFGCGFEGQLESWYQFLIQPDPWASISVTNKVASRVGVNTTVLKQRHDFLRPTSLVAVIAVSDEDDSTVDPGSFSGTSWVFEDRPVLALPTTDCAANPNSATCTSCEIIANNGQLAAHPECQQTGAPTSFATYSTNPQPNDPDNPNVRFARMKQRFGIDPQYPVSRYLNGLVGTNSVYNVPDRRGENHGSDGRYNPTNNCRNPLYAASLPDGTGLSATIATDTPPSDADLNTLCNLQPGTRDPSLVFFGFIGGVPWQLLTHNPTTATTDPNVAFIAQSSGDDIPESTWTQLIGNSPETYDYSGQSAYMQVSLMPRAMLSPPSSSNTMDPFNGREYYTAPPTKASAMNNGADLEYACTFQLPNKLDCSAAAIAADKPNTLPYNGLLQTICDCADTTDNDGNVFKPTGPLCGDGVTDPVNTQIRGKAYPGIREFTLVHAMDQQAAKNGIAASLCPRTITAATNDPNYGYNPAVEAIVAKLKNALGNTCLPRSLTLNADGLAPCSILELLPAGQSGCDASKGLTPPTADVSARYFADQAASGNGDSGASPSGRTLCVLQPLQSGCESSGSAGWCYEAKTDGGNTDLGICSQAIKFSPSGIITGASISLECLESSTAAGGGSDSGTTSTNP